MQENLNQQLKTKGFISGGYRATPLTKFWGRWSGYTQEITQFNRLRVNFQFIDVEVVKSTEPYDLPTAIIPVNYSGNVNSVWALTMDKVYEKYGGRETIIEKIASHFGVEPEMVDAEGSEITSNLPDLFPAVLEGTRLLLELTPGHELGTDRISGKQIVVDVWEVVEVEGAGVELAVSPEAEALKLLEGRTTAQFNQLALQSPTIRGSELYTPIVNKSFLMKLEADGKAKKDAKGIWHLI